MAKYRRITTAIPARNITAPWNELIWSSWTRSLLIAARNRSRPTFQSQARPPRLNKPEERARLNLISFFLRCDQGFQSNAIRNHKGASVLLDQALLFETGEQPAHGLA